MEFLGIGPSELIFVFIIALIILGPKDMQKAGKTIGKAVERALARRGKRRPPPELFGTWFRQWTAQGLFSEIEGRTRRRSR